MVNRKFIDRTSKDELGKSENGNDVDKNGHGEEVTVHHLPFKVEYNGMASVDVKFTEKSLPLVEGSETLINQFRGRPLHGRKLELPKNFEGVIASDLKGPSGMAGDDDDDSSRGSAEISLVKRFDSMTYWNWDKVPSGMDKHIKLLDWLEISEALHEPIQPSTS